MMYFSRPSCFMRLTTGSAGTAGTSGTSGTAGTSVFSGYMPDQKEGER